MFSARKAGLLAALLALPTLLASTSALAQARYTVTDLGVLSGKTTSFAWSINDHGVVTVYNYSNPDESDLLPGLYTPGSGQTQLPLLPVYQTAVPNAINNAGVVAGNASNGNIVSVGGFTFGYSVPVVWTNGIPEPLPLMEETNYGSATGISNRDKVVGACYIVFPGFILPLATYWQNGHVHSLNSPYPASAAVGVNDAGEVVGAAGDSLSQFDAALWDAHGNFTDLGTLGGSQAVAVHINAVGEAVGYSTTASGAAHAFSWMGGTMTDLGTLPGGMASLGEGINNGGRIVGIAVDANGNAHAVAWKNGQIADLNAEIAAGSGWYLAAAYGINQPGQIVGEGVINGAYHGFLLTPIKP